MIPWVVAKQFMERICSDTLHFLSIASAESIHRSMPKGVKMFPYIS